MYTTIAGMGRCTPEQIWSNEALVARYGLSVDAAWIERKTGILERHWLRPGEATSDLAAGAARAALAAASLRPSDVDLFVLATVCPDHPSPSTATIVARKIGLSCPAFDLSAACAGFLYGLEVAASAIESGRKRRALVIAADARSRYLDPKDHRALVLFADGAAGALLVPSERPGLLSVYTGADGQENMGAWVPAGGTARPTSPETVAAGEHYVHVDGKEEIFERFVAYTRHACAEALAMAGLALSDIDLFVTHQGNARMVERTVAALGIDPARAINSIARHGNVSGATVPLALSEAIEQGRISEGGTALLTSVGAGYTFGAAVWRAQPLPPSTSAPCVASGVSL